MELQQLIYVLTVYETRNITKAAELLHITQPTLSQQIRNVEDSMCIKLFQRAPHHFSVTPEGEEFVRLARPVIEKYNELTDGIKRYTEDNATILKIGILPTLGRTGFPDFIGEFCEKYPDIRVEITEDFSTRLCDSLYSGMLDTAIINSFPSLDIYAQKIKYYEIASSHICLVCSKHHPLASLSHIRLEDAMAYPMVLFPKESSIENLLSEASGKSSSNQSQIIRISNVANMLSIIVNGKYISFLSASLISESSMPRIRAIPIEPRIVAKRYLGISPVTASKPAASLFASFISEKFSSSLND